MHTLLVLASILFVVLSGYLALGLLRRLTGWSRRRNVQLLVLSGPVLSLVAGFVGLHHFAGRVCFVGVPDWDYLTATALPLVMGMAALGGIGLGVIRLALMRRVVARHGIPAHHDVQALATRLAEQIGAPAPHVLLCAHQRPLALACGLRQPIVLLSTWMVEQLDQRELESVLAHEIGHVARRDYVVIWLATVLRDAFFYLPTSWAAYRLLQHEKELACDELTVGATKRPLALASALAKVWQHSLYGANFAGAPQLVGTGTAIEGRIARLLTPPVEASASKLPSRSLPGITGVSATAVGSLLILATAVPAVVLTSMGCGLGSLMGRLF